MAVVVPVWAAGPPVVLFYWADKWVLCDFTRVSQAPEYISHLDQVPANGVYLIKGSWANTWHRPFKADSVSEGAVWY